MHHPTDRIAHTTAFVTPVVEHWLEREIAQWVLPMKDRSDDYLLINIYNYDFFLNPYNWFLGIENHLMSYTISTIICP